MNLSTFSPFCWVNPLFLLEKKAFLLHSLHKLVHTQSFFLRYLQLGRLMQQRCSLSGSPSCFDDVTGQVSLVCLRLNKVAEGKRRNSGIMGVWTWNVPQHVLDAHWHLNWYWLGSCRSGEGIGLPHPPLKPRAVPPSYAIIFLRRAQYQLESNANYLRRAFQGSQL